MAITVPRWITPILGLFAWLVVIPLVHFGIPWALSMLAPRYGWAEGRPGTFNLVGLIPLAAGAMCLFWVMVVGLAQTHKLPEGIKLDWSPKLLVMNGPYAFSRNPMYVAEAMLWFGCAIFFGSISVLIGLVILCVAVNVLVRHEEPALGAEFGETYLRYKATVPRWLGKRLPNATLNPAAGAPAEGDGR